MVEEYIVAEETIKLERVSGKGDLETFHDAVAKALTDHATTVGQISISWNRLMRTFGDLFVFISGIEDTLAFAIWNIPRSDKVSREMLMAAVNHRYSDSDIALHRYKRRLLCWLVTTQCDAYSGHRDRAVHSPYAVVIRDGGLAVIPDAFSGNHLASQFKGSDLKAVLDAYLNNLNSLEKFAKEILSSIVLGDETPWPEKPILQDIPKPDPSSTPPNPLLAVG